MCWVYGVSELSPARSRLSEWRRRLSGLRGDPGRSALSVLRNSAQFWPFYDWINRWNREPRGDAAGWLDLSYYEAPETWAERRI